MVANDSLIQPPQFFERIAKVVMRLSKIGIDGEGLRDEINGNVAFSHLMGNHAKQMQGVRLIGVGLQYLLINALGLGQATRSLVLHREFYGLGVLDGQRRLLGGRVC